jgi:hypothetical protein
MVLEGVSKRLVRHDKATGIGKEFRLDDYASVSSVVARMKKALTHDGRLRKQVGRLQRQL